MWQETTQNANVTPARWRVHEDAWRRLPCAVLVTLASEGPGSWPDGAGVRWQSVKLWVWRGLQQIIGRKHEPGPLIWLSSCKIKTGEVWSVQWTQCVHIKMFNTRSHYVNVFLTRVINLICLFEQETFTGQVEMSCEDKLRIFRDISLSWFRLHKAGGFMFESLSRTELIRIFVPEESDLSIACSSLRVMTERRLVNIPRQQDYLNLQSYACKKDGILKFKHGRHKFTATEQ